MQCPHCNSDNCQRLEVAYQSGTSNIQTRSSGVGVGMGRGGIGVGVGNSKTSGTSQTQLAQKASPPKKKRYLPLIIAFFIGWIIASDAGLKHWIWLILGVAAVILSCYMGYQAYRFNRETWPGLYQIWMESWICHKCGQIFHPA